MSRHLPTPEAVRARALRGAMLLVVVTLALAGAVMWADLKG